MIKKEHREEIYLIALVLLGLYLSLIESMKDNWITDLRKQTKVTDKSIQLKPLFYDSKLKEELAYTKIEIDIYKEQIDIYEKCLN